MVEATCVVEVCKTFTRGFDSPPRLQKALGNSGQFRLGLSLFRCAVPQAAWNGF